jgi:predicted Zn finger-like uncharacterized protein
MRLICPNCDAEYEVDGDQISAEGRDVQCSNCAHTWLQMPEGFDDTVEPDPVAPPESTEVEAQPAVDDEDVTDAGFAPPEGAETPPMRRTTDPDALDVIHQEVQHELRHRDAETGGIETQTELGLDQGSFAPTPPPPAPETKPELTPEAPSQTETKTPDETVDAGLAPAHQRSEGNKRELLPDIEEINSTLAAAPDPVYDEDGNIDESTAKGGRRGFRLGFGLMLLLTALILLFYAYAPLLKENFPQLTTLIDNLVRVIDNLRLALENAAQGLLKMLNGLLEGFGN